ncbi:MAG: hypothetical protein R6X14_01950 [bacterium]
MLVDKLDVAALRLCEERGTISDAAGLTAAGLTAGEFHARLRKLSAAGVLRCLKASLAVPPLLGGDWVWASLLATASRPLGIANLLLKRLPFVTEVLLNASLPPRVGPNLAVLFYSRDYDTEARYVRSISGMEHCEVCRVAEYSFPVSRSLSTDERNLLRQVAAHPAAEREELVAAVGQRPEWVQAKLEQLTWTPTNGSGILRVQPELDWTRVENFGHCHFLLATGHRPAQLRRLLTERGFELVLEGKPYRDRYIQVEADCWGMADVVERVSFLDQTTGISVRGVLLNQQVIINADWVAGLLS